jgi:hypothetical protein
MEPDRGLNMDLQKLIKKLPAFLKRFQDAKNFDKKFTFADIEFVLDLIRIGTEEAARAPEAQLRYAMAVNQGQDGLTGSHIEALDPKNHSQMIAYLEKLPERVAFQSASPTPTQAQSTSQGYTITPAEDPRGFTQWLPVIMFGVDLLGKLLAAWKKRK